MERGPAGGIRRAPRVKDDHRAERFSWRMSCSQPGDAMEDCDLRTEQIPANTQGIEAGSERGEYLTDVRRHARHD